ncbi:MAG: FecR domain-containing protein, partial [Magnetospirillum sp. WYHS-4]
MSLRLPEKGVLLREEGSGEFRLVLAADGPVLTVADGRLLVEGEYHRLGPDLVIVGKDGGKVLIKGYFSQENPPDLTSGGGTVIDGALAARLAGPLAPGQYAQAGAMPVAQPIGKVTKLNGSVTVTHADGVKAPLKGGDSVFADDVVETAGDGGIGIEFADKTTFALGPKGRMVLDDMVYDPGAAQNKLGISLVKGVFSVVSGAIAKENPDAMVIKTPVATVGIRGTKVTGEVRGEGQENSFSLLTEAGGLVGEITITNSGGVQVLNQAGATTTVSSFTQPPPPPVLLSPNEIDNRYGQAVDRLLPDAQQTPQAPQPATPPAPKDTQGQIDAPDVAKTLADLKAAIEASREQVKQFEQKVELAVERVDRLLAERAVDENAIANRIVAENRVDYSADVSKLLAVVEAASAAAKVAGDAEDAAAAKVTSLGSQVLIKATAGSVGLDSTEAQQLASVVTAPLKALGAAGALSATIASLSKAALALAAEAGSGKTIPAEVLAKLEAMLGLGAGASGDSLVQAAAKMAKIVTAAISASDAVLTSTITEAKAVKLAGGDVLAAAKAKAAGDFADKVNEALVALQPGEASPIQFGDLGTIAGAVKTQMTDLSTAAQGGTLGDTVGTSLSCALTAATQAETTATNAESTIGAADPAAMLAFAELAITAATATEAARAEADAAVDLTELAKLLDASASSLFLQAVEADAEAESEAGQATLSITGSVGDLEAAQSYIDGSIQAKVAAAHTAAVAADAAAAVKVTQADAAAEAVKAARATLIDHLVAEAVAVAKLDALNSSLTEASAAVTDAAADVTAATTARDAAQTAYDDAKDLSDAAPESAALATATLLKAQLLANAEAAVDLAESIQALYASAKTTIEGKIATAEDVYDAAHALVVADEGTIVTLEAAASTALQAALTAVQADSDAQVAAAQADGELALARAAAEGQAQATFEVAVETLTDLTSTIATAAAKVAAAALEAKSWAIIGTANKINANAAETKALAALAEVQAAETGLADAWADVDVAYDLDFQSQDGAAVAARLAAYNSAKAALASAQAQVTAAEAAADLATAASNLADVINPEPVDPTEYQVALADAQAQADDADATFNAKKTDADTAKAESVLKAAAQAAQEASATAVSAQEANLTEAAAAAVVAKTTIAESLATQAKAASLAAIAAETADNGTAAETSALLAESLATQAKAALAEAQQAAKESELHAAAAVTAAAGNGKGAAEQAERA